MKKPFSRLGMSWNWGLGHLRGKTHLKPPQGARGGYAPFGIRECLLVLDSFSAVTRIALFPLPGHSCSQMPQPVQSAGST